MQFRIEQRFDATVAVIEDVLSDPAFIGRMADLPKLGRPQLISQTPEGDRLRQRIRYAFAGDLSPAVRRVVDPSRLTWIEDSVIDRAMHRSIFRILPDNYAHLLRCDGAFSLVPDANGCRRLATGTITVNVPLVGAKVERAIVSGLEEHAAGEVDLVAHWLADRPT